MRGKRKTNNSRQGAGQVEMKKAENELEKVSSGRAKETKEKQKAGEQGARRAGTEGRRPPGARCGESNRREVGRPR